MPSTNIERLALVRQLAITGEARRLRQDAGISLREIAEACGVDTGTVWKWETGRRRPRGETSLRYLKVLERLTAVTQRAAA